MRRLGAAGVAALSLVLAGCAGGGGPDPTSSTTSSATTESRPTVTSSSTETVAVPVQPEEAKVETDLGAVAFVQHWFALLNYGYKTGDVQPLQGASRSECNECVDFVSIVRDLSGDGSVATEDPLVIETVNSPPPELGVVNTSVTYRTRAIVVRSATGSEETMGEDSDVKRLEAAVSWQDGGWKMLEIGS